MITYHQGDLLLDDAQALVNPVNTVGVMGKGLALQFKQRFPANFAAYARACKLGQVVTGRVFVTEPGDSTGPRWVVNFPTKEHWREPSRVQWVIRGLLDLRSFLMHNSVPSIALPALGAGLGALPWVVLRGHVEFLLCDLPVDVRVYEPHTASNSPSRLVNR